MFSKFIIVRGTEGQYLSYDEESDNEWYFGHSKHNAYKFTHFGEFEKVYEKLKNNVLYGYTEFNVELLYIKD